MVRSSFSFIFPPLLGSFCGEVEKGFLVASWLFKGDEAWQEVEKWVSAFPGPSCHDYLRTASSPIWMLAGLNGAMWEIQCQEDGVFQSPHPQSSW